MRINLIIGVWILTRCTVSLAQGTGIDPYAEAKAGNKIFNFQFNYTYQIPEGDLALRFGPLHQVGAGVNLKTRNHWYFALQANYQFGYTVEEPGLFYFLTNSSGYITNTGGYPATYYLSQRGMSGIISAGRLFPLSLSNRNSGILVMVGGGYLLHKINIASPSNDIPTLTDELKRGYDRLTGGFALHQFVGYYFQSANRYFNFYVGVDLNQAFTKSFRGYNYDQRAFDNASRFDATNGLRVGWMIPIYLATKDEDEFDFK